MKWRTRFYSTNLAWKELKLIYFSFRYDRTGCPKLSASEEIQFQILFPEAPRNLYKNLSLPANVPFVSFIVARLSSLQPGGESLPLPLTHCSFKEESVEAQKNRKRVKPPFLHISLPPEHRGHVATVSFASIHFLLLEILADRGFHP